MPNQKGFAQIALVVFLLVGIVITVYLVGQQTNLLPKAFLPPQQAPETSFALVSSFEKLPDPAPLFNSAAQGSGGMVTEPIKVKLSYEVGDVVPVALLTRSDIDEANLFAAKLKFNKELLEVVSVKIPDIPVNLPDPIAKIMFIKNWVEQSYNQNEGTISLVGGVPAPGYKTNVRDYPGVMTLILFKAKKVGSAAVSLTDQSQILRNSDNINILTAKRDTTINIKDKVLCVAVITPAKDPRTGVCKEFPTPCDVPAGWEKVDKCPTPPECKPPPPPPPPGCRYIIGDPPRDDPNRCPAYTLVCSQKGDGNKDGKINLVDMSVLLSDFNKEKEFREAIDMNEDKKINSFDFSLMRKQLIELKVIKGQ